MFSVASLTLYQNSLFNTSHTFLDLYLSVPGVHLYLVTLNQNVTTLFISVIWNKFIYALFFARFLLRQIEEKNLHKFLCSFTHFMYFSILKLLQLSFVSALENMNDDASYILTHITWLQELKKKLKYNMVKYSRVVTKQVWKVLECFVLLSCMSRIVHTCSVTTPSIKRCWKVQKIGSSTW